MTALLDYYRGTGTDQQGRTLDDFFDFDFDTLEADHQFIQWVFPLPEPSAFNPEAPILTAEDAKAFKTDRALRNSVQKAVLRMTNFYGTSDHWLTVNNHNYLRVTRIIKFLALCRFETLAQYVWNFASGRASSVSGCRTPRTADFWSEALNTPEMADPA